MSAPRTNRLLIIGIDGGTFAIIKPMVERGELPNIGSLMKKGVSEDLRSTIPPITAPAWLSFMTGKNPGKHGIFHFTGKTHATYRGKIQSASDLKTKTIWTILSKYGKHMTLVNVPLTYPPSRINGIMISGIGTPPESRNFTYPHGIYQELLQEVGDYRIDYTDDRIFLSSQNLGARLDALIKNLNDMTEKRTRAALYLLERDRWDIFMLVYVITDRLQHLCWKFMDNTHPDYDPELGRLFGEAVFAGYRKVDEAVGRIIRKLDENVTVLIMSDHGFGPLQKCFFVNRWLRKIGYLKLKRTLPWRLSATPASVRRVLTKLGMGVVTRALPASVLEYNIPRVKILQKTWDELVDWTRTQAYAADSLGISINLKDREPEGIVSPGKSADELLGVLEEELCSLRDPESGQRVVDRVDRRENLYQGPYVDEAPDLLFEMQGLSCLPYPYSFSGRNLFGAPPNRWSGTHRFNGILIMKGPEIRDSVRLQDPQITDLAPTILYLFNQKIPEDMDGRVLTEAFQRKILDDYPVVFDGSGEDEGQGPDAGLSERDEDEVRKHLKDLGYLS
ncbi:MAG: alkaline phosphatase family protein [Nitrospirota bacterium]